jgi:hypothetical protein
MFSASAAGPGKRAADSTRAGEAEGKHQPELLVHQPAGRAETLAAAAGAVALAQMALIP